MRPPYGANCLVTIGGVSCGPVPMSSFPLPGWVELANGPVPLRCWWATPQITANDIDSKSFISRIYAVLLKLFGVNTWVRSVGDRLAAHGHPAWRCPCFFARRLIWIWPMRRLIWPAAGATRTPPPQIQSSVMSSQRSAACGPVTPRPPFMWWCSASGGHVAFRAARCYPGL